jgi:hypothetical protein
MRLNSVYFRDMLAPVRIERAAYRKLTNFLLQILIDRRRLNWSMTTYAYRFGLWERAETWSAEEVLTPLALDRLLIHLRAQLAD